MASAWWCMIIGDQVSQAVIAAGGLLLVAFAVAEVLPAISSWAYLAAALIGLVPIARRAVVGAMSDTPFTTAISGCRRPCQLGDRGHAAPAPSRAERRCRARSPQRR